MARIGEFNCLEVLRKQDFGFYLNGGELGDILLPKRYAPEGCEIGQELDVFIYLDSEDRLIATTETPKAQVGQIAFLQVIAKNNIGAFLDWGLPKDLLVPFREQRVSMEIGRQYLVAVYLDHESQRLAASSKINKFLDNTPPDYEVNQLVDVLIAEETEIGYKTIIQHEHWGMLYKNEVFKKLKPGMQMQAYIKKIREDEKIDLILEQQGYTKIEAISNQILEELKSNNGILPISDKSHSELIQKQFGISKKNFKKAIGLLYKKKLIHIERDQIKLA